MINVWSYLEEYETEKTEILNAIESVLSSGQLILGPNVQGFETEFASWCGSNYGVGVANGTDAIFLACKAMGLKDGDEVITVSNTAVPTVSAITAAGGIPVFVDVDPKTCLMDVKSVQSKITNKTKLILPVHLYGQTVDMDPLIEIAKDKNLGIIEDCAQAHGALYKDRKAGSMGDIGAFSFYPTKILGTFGDGGLCITNSANLRNQLKKLRFYGMDGRYYSEEQGYNSRLDEIHAAILLKKLTYLDNYIERRRSIAYRYTKYLQATNYVLPEELPTNQHAFYLYVVQHEQRDKIIHGLAEKKIKVNISYPWPIHTMTGFSDYSTSCQLPITESVANRIFSLPMFPSLTNKDQDHVIEVLIELDKQYS